MSDFIASNLHKKVDHLMDIFFGAGVASHPTIIEQINYLLFMRALSQKDEDLKKIGVTDPDKIVFDGELEKYHWDNLLTLNAEQLFIALEECFRKIPESTTNRTVRLVFRNAHIKLFDKPSLRTVVHELDAFAKLMDDEEHDGKRDIFGDTYEYLLSKLSQAGTSGQFRTPRHIIEFLVAVIAPKKGETILDPAVGTAGFLVKAFEYLRLEYTSTEQLASGGAFDKLNSKEHSFLYEHTFNGFDSDEDMIKFGMMNLYLHGLQNAHMLRQNSLTDTAGSRDKYDIILANPPFSGKIDRDSVAEELQMNTGATEVLFLRYMMRHLTQNGRVGVIVPEGVLFNTSGAHKKIREMLLEHGLWCVVSLPAGVFNPYAGVKTSILFFDKAKKKRQEVLFTKVEQDGFTLGSQRKHLTKNDLPEVLSEINLYHSGKDLQLPSAHVVSYDRIEDSDNFSLNGDQYKIIAQKENNKWPKERLAKIANVRKGSPITKSKTDPNGVVPVVAGGQKAAYLHNIANREADVVTVSASGAYSGFVNYWETPIFASDCSTVETLDKRVVSTRYIYEVLKYLQDDIYKLQRGGGQPHVYPKDLLDIEIPLPPIEIQSLITRQIDKYRILINGANQIVNNWQPTIEISGDWPVVDLGTICDFKNGLNFSRSSKGESIKVLGVGHFKNNFYAPIADAETIVIDDKLKDDYLLKEGDLLFVRSNGNQELVGRSIIIPKILNRISFSGFTIRGRFSKDQNPNFYAWLFKSEIHNKLFKNVGQGANIRNLSQDILKKIKVPMPPRPVQDKKVKEIEDEQALVKSASKLTLIYEKKIAQTIADLWSE